MVLSARDRERKNYETPLQHPLATGHLHLIPEGHAISFR